MPCFDPRPDTDIKDAQRKNDHLTKLLCEACQWIDLRACSDPLRQWCAEHRQSDEDRVKQELADLHEELQRRLDAKFDRLAELEKSLGRQVVPT